MFRLVLLGAATIRDASGATIPLAARRHPLALLALLATAPGRSMGRSRAAGLLWPACAEQAARNRLSTAVHQLRAVLGGDVPGSRGDELVLDEAAIDCDLFRFEAAQRDGELLQAAACYGGPLLHGFELGRSPEFQDHMALERERLAACWCQLLETLADRARRCGQLQAAVDWWRQRAAADRCDARVARRLMEALDAVGNRSEALRVANANGRALSEELGVAPDPAVEQLARRLAGGDAAGPAATAGAAAPSSTVAAPARSVAVLPFENLSGNGDADPFAAGLHDDLLTELSRLQELKVIARTSVQRYRGTQLPAETIGRELGVGSLIDGSVQQLDGRLRVNVQLVDAARGCQRWAERYEIDLDANSLFGVQSRLVRSIAAELRAELAPVQRSAIARRSPTGSIDAYRLHAQGRQRLAQLNAAAVREAATCFRRAIDCDAGYALAWVGLADALMTLADYCFDTNTAARIAEAESVARHALTLAPDLPEARATLGLLHCCRRRGLPAVRELSHAIELRPGYAQAYDWLSWSWQCIGQADAAVASGRIGVELDPLLPEAVKNLASSLLASGDAVAALHVARSLREIAPGLESGRFYEAFALYTLGEHAQVPSILEDITVPWDAGAARCLLGMAHARCGEIAAARAAIAALQATGQPFAAGLVHLALGEPDVASAVFDAVTDWTPYWTALAVHHHFADLWQLLRGSQAQRIRGEVLRAWGLQAETGAPDEVLRLARAMAAGERNGLRHPMPA